MKKYVSILTILLLIVSSCSDQLERTPVDQLVEETAYRTVADLEFGLAGFLGNYNPTRTLSFNSIFTDNCKLGSNNGGQELNTLNQILNADGGDRGIWAGNYAVLNDINRLLEAADRISPTGAAEQATYNNIRAQSHAFRALLHYEILLYYGLDMTDPSSQGVPYVDYVSADAEPARNTTGEVLAGIQSDLDTALALFPAGTADINFATPDFVTFLRARIALETGDNTGAIAFANNLISQYPLANMTQYLAMYREDADTTEVIWKYDSVQGFNLGLTFLWNFGGPSPFIEMSNELAGLLLPGDIRTTVLIDPISNTADSEFVIGKYPANADFQFINDLKAMRISEIYLIRAEAQARNMQFGPAAADVLAVRTARNMNAPAPITYSSVAEALTDILAERRLELAFEGHRYIDIKRMRSVLNMGIERELSDCGGAVPCSLSPSSEKFTFPVPTAEINGNNNITQAPGY